VSTFHKHKLPYGAAHVGVGFADLYQLPFDNDNGAVLCCAVLCCAVLCCAVLCCAVLCCATNHGCGKAAVRTLMLINHLLDVQTWHCSAWLVFT